MSFNLFYFFKLKYYLGPLELVHLTDRNYDFFGYLTKKQNSANNFSSNFFPPEFFPENWVIFKNSQNKTGS